MRKHTAVLLAVFLAATSVDADTVWTFHQVASNFSEVATSILTSGKKLIDKLEDTQAKDVVDQIYSKATKLVDEKTDLQKSIQDGKQVVISQKMLDEVFALSRLLERFGAEIDKVSGLSSGELRNKAHFLLTDKLSELHKTQVAIYNGDSTAALNTLELAISDAAQIQRAACCLSKTLDKKEPACNADTLQPLPEKK
jgi:hypothetical protein